MSTVDEIRLDVQAQGYATDTSVTQLRLMDRAWKRVMNTRRWTFNDFTEQVNVVNGEFDLTNLTENMRFFDGVRLAPDQPDPKFLAYQEFRDFVGTGVATGQPTHYTRRGTKLLFYPVSSFTAEVDFNRDPPPPSSLNPATDDLGIPDVLEEALVFAIVKLLATRERDTDMATQADADYQRIINEYMATNMDQRQNAQYVANTGQWDSYTNDPYPYG